MGTIRIYARWGLAAIGLFNAVVTIHEYLTRPDEDLWVEQIGSFVSLHSIYIGLAAVGILLMLPGAWPVLMWLYKIPERYRAKLLERKRREEERVKNMEKKELDSLNETIRSITQLLKELNRHAKFGGVFSEIPDADTNIMVSRENLIRRGVIPESYREKTYIALEDYLKRIRPDIIQHGVEKGVALHKKEFSKRKTNRKQKATT